MTLVDAEWLNRHLSSSTVRHGYKEPTDRIACVDGFSVSVQASRYTYCEPRNDSGPWSHVECGFPRNALGVGVCVDEWQEWADVPGSPATVYGYMPIEAVVAWINAHGGVVVEVES